MNDTQLGVSIAVDPSGVAPGVAKTESDLAAITPYLQQLTAQFAELATAVHESLGKPEVALTESLRAAEAETEKETALLREMALSVREGVESFARFREMIAHVGEAFLAFFAVEGVIHFTEHMGEAAEKVDHLSQRLGISVMQFQSMQAVALGTGISIDSLTKGLTMMDNRAITSAGASSAAAQAFKFLGISANDGRSNMERLLQIADKFSEVSDGPTKAGLAMQAFGRSGAELIPILNLGSKGIQELMDKAQEYGVVNVEAEERGKKLAEAVNESNIAWLGLKTTLMEALAPALTATTQGFTQMVVGVVHSYQEGGTARQVFDALAGAAHTVWTAMSALGPVLMLLVQHIGLVIAALETLVTLMALRYAAAAVTAVASSAAFSTALFAIEARAAGAATTMEALALVSGTAGRAMLAAMGGPIGIAVGLLAAGIYLLYTHTNQAAVATGRYAEAVEVARRSSEETTAAVDKLATAHGEARKRAEEEANAHLRNAAAKLKDAQASVILAQAEMRRAFQAHQEEASHSTPMVGMGSGGTPGMGFNPAVSAAAARLDQARANVIAAQKAAASLQADVNKLTASLAAPPPSFTAPDITPVHKGHEKKEKDDLVQQLDEQLKAKQVAWAMQQDAQGTAQEYSLQATADYWKAALARDDLSQKDKLAIEEKYLAAHSALVKDGIAKEVEGYKIRIDEAKGNSAERLRIATEEAAYIGRMFGLESREYREAQDQIVRIKREATLQERRIAEEHSKAIENLRLGEVDAAEAAAHFLVQMGVRTDAQLLVQQRAFENERFRIKQEALQRELAITDPNRDPVTYAKISAQIEALEQGHQARLTQIAHQQALQRTAVERGAISSISSSWASAISKLVTLQAGLVTTVKSLYQGLQQALGGALMAVIQKWMEQHLAMLLFGRATKTAEATAEVASNAAVAGSAAFASTAAIPIIGPALAPEAAAAAYAATLAFLPLASAAKGWGSVPYDGMMTELHKEEMVLPANIATPLRGVLSAIGSWGLGAIGLATRRDDSRFDPAAAVAGGTREGDVHLHLSAVDGRSARRFLLDHRSHLADALRSAARDNLGGR